MRKHFDLSLIILIALTIILLVLAIFSKGFTRDVLLEFGIFLVSAKLIILAYKNSAYNKELKAELKEIKNLIKKNNKKN